MPRTDNSSLCPIGHGEGGFRNYNLTVTGRSRAHEDHHAVPSSDGLTEIILLVSRAQAPAGAGTCEAHQHLIVFKSFGMDGECTSQ